MESQRDLELDAFGAVSRAAYVASRADFTPGDPSQLYIDARRVGDRRGAEEGAACGPYRCGCRSLGARGARVELDGEIISHGDLDLDRSPSCRVSMLESSGEERTAFARDTRGSSGRSQQPFLKYW